MPICVQVARRNADGRATAMAGLHAKEGDRRVGLHRRAAHRAGRAVDAAWNIDGDDVLAAFATPAVQAADKRAGVRIEIAREARSEQSVDNEIDAVEAALERGA